MLVSRVSNWGYSKYKYICREESFDYCCGIILVKEEESY